jgi:hypothetical protein
MWNERSKVRVVRTRTFLVSGVVSITDIAKLGDGKGDAHANSSLHHHLRHM